MGKDEKRKEKEIRPRRGIHQCENKLKALKINMKKIKWRGSSMLRSGKGFSRWTTGSMLMQRKDLYLVLNRWKRKWLQVT